MINPSAHFVTVWYGSTVVDPNLGTDPDKVRSETWHLSGSGSGNNHPGSGQLRIRNKFEVKLL
jgi:hypothetical protein